MINLLLSTAFALTTVYAPMTTQLETSVVHHFVNKDFHSKKKDLGVISWADCGDMGHRECAMMRGYWYLDVIEFEGEDTYQINIFLYDEQSRIVAEAIIEKRYKIEKIPQKTTIKGTKVERGTVAPFKTEIEKPPVLIKRKPEITDQDISQAVIRLMTRIKK
tara:strand:- start:994 stop:1479 length:486 start_codon:yes stop_codon:yes gene_type:complete